MKWLNFFEGRLRGTCHILPRRTKLNFKICIVKCYLCLTLQRKTSLEQLAAMENEIMHNASLSLRKLRLFRYITLTWDEWLNYYPLQTVAAVGIAGNCGNKPIMAWHNAFGSYSEAPVPNGNAFIWQIWRASLYAFQSNVKQGRQCAYSVILRHVCAVIVAVERQ